jgi:ankyrin repeat protein
MPTASGRVEELQIKKLLHSVRTEDYYQIKKLVEKGVDQLINYNEPNDGDTALILAATMNNDHMLQFLLDIGAHPNVVDFQVVKTSKIILLKCVSNLDTLNTKGRTALARAAELGHVQVMEVLKKAKADAKIRDNEGRCMTFA